MAQPDHRDHEPLRVLIAGGGVAALEALVALRAMAPGLVAPQLVSAADAYVDRPLMVGEPFGLGHPRRYRLADICSSLATPMTVDVVDEVLTEARVVTTHGGRELEYDVLLVATGAHHVPAFEHGTTFDREIYPDDFDDILVDLGDGLAPHIAIVVPDGVQWSLPGYELALLTAAWGARRHPDDVVVTVVTHEPAPLAQFGRAVSDAVDELLVREHVALRTGVHADVVTDTALRTGGEWLRADRIVSLPRQAGPRLAGLPFDERGFLPIDERCRVVGVDDVYAAGDGVAFPIKQGGLAAQQADCAAAHIAARAGAAVQPQPLSLVLRGMLRTPHGPRYLRAELARRESTSTIAEEPLWWPPSKVASRWLAPHLARLEADRHLRSAPVIGP